MPTAGRIRVFGVLELLVAAFIAFKVATVAQPFVGWPSIAFGWWGGLRVLLLRALGVRLPRRSWRAGRDDRLMNWLALGAILGVIALGCDLAVRYPAVAGRWSMVAFAGFLGATGVQEIATGRASR